MMNIALLPTKIAQAIDISPLPNSSGGDAASIFKGSAFNIAFGVIGAVCLLMIVIGGIRYIFSEGDSNAMSKAKGTIVYALVGLAISLAAFSIVSFVVKGVK